MSIIIESKTQPILKEASPTNSTADSQVQIYLNHLEFNIFFDGTWNSKKNSDHYNDPENLQKDDFKDPKGQKKKYNLGTSFSRAPTGVDQMHRATKDDDPYIIPLYVDGSGTESWEDHNNKPKGDNAIGAGFGWFKTGVSGKLDKMYKQIKNKIDKLISEDKVVFHSIIFNVYGFSRGAATARIFCNRIMKQKRIKLESEYVLEENEYLDLTPYQITLKMVGLFDTVSSIGVDHTNDMNANDQSMDFGQCFSSGKIVHILAGHEFRQKFNVTSIKRSVLDGNGFELVMPGCHTDIGDGLNTEKEYNKKLKEYDEVGRDERKIILQKYRIYDDEPDDILLPSINPLRVIMPVANTEARARKETNNANYTEVMNYLVEQGWFNHLEEEIVLEKDKIFEKLKVDRIQLSSDYPKIPTFIMIEIIKKFNAYYFKEDYLVKYKIETTQDSKLQEMYDNLKLQAFEKLQKNLSGVEKKFVETRIQDGKQLIPHEFDGKILELPYIDIQGNEELRKLMYNRYLHWCSSMKFNIKSMLTHVNIAHIDIRTNRFYRNVVEG